MIKNNNEILLIKYFLDELRWRKINLRNKDDKDDLSD